MMCRDWQREKHRCLKNSIKRDGISGAYFWYVHQVELADGRTSVREVVVHGPAVAIVACRKMALSIYSAVP